MSFVVDREHTLPVTNIHELGLETQRADSSLRTTLHGISGHEQQLTLEQSEGYGLEYRA